MIVMEEMKQGSLRSNLKVKTHNPNDKYKNLYCVAKSLAILHDCNLIHGNLHGGIYFYRIKQLCILVILD